MSSEEPTTPWYRQFWPWFVIALPASVVIAGFFTLYLALSNPVSLVKDNYYKEGLGINQDLARDRAAAELGITAELLLDREIAELRLRLDGVPAGVAQVSLFFAHPTDSERDFSVLLRRAPGGEFVGELPQPLAERWYLRLEGDQPASWRLRGELAAGGERAVLGDAPAP